MTIAKSGAPTLAGADGTNRRSGTREGAQGVEPGSAARKAVVHTRALAPSPAHPRGHFPWTPPTRPFTPGDAEAIHTRLAWGTKRAKDTKLRLWSSAVPNITRLALHRALWGQPAATWAELEAVTGHSRSGMREAVKTGLVAWNGRADGLVELRFASRAEFDAIELRWRQHVHGDGPAPEVAT